MSDQHAYKLAEQNNQGIRDAVLGHLFPLRGGPRRWAAPANIDQMRKDNEASVSLSNLIDGMDDEERPAAGVKRG